MMKPVAQTKEARYNYARIFVKQGPPQGMTEEQFRRVSLRLRERLKEEAGRTGDLGDDIFVHGSRGRGDAGSDADLDIGIRVSAERFDDLLRARLARVKPEGDKWKTLQEAVRQGRLHSGEVGISGIKREIQRLINDVMGLGFKEGVQVTVIREAGPFDAGPFIPLPNVKS
jgi:predicted nucleotidyltransferase